MIRNIIFDFGGVLVDWDPHRLLDNYFGSREKADWFIANICTGEWNAEMDAGKPFAQGIAELSAKYPEWAHEIQLYFDRWIEMIGGEVTGMLQIVKELKAKGYKLYGLTNWSAETFCQVRHKFEVFDQLDGMLVSGEEKMLKPAPEFFQLLVDRFGINPAESLFIDDNQPNVDGAIAFGINAIRFENAETLRKQLITLVYEN
ncbi:MAG: HAD family phosphatase [Bacteroidales bacterium]|nr:HAD family phosphatase [Bacteroidales bacterium]